LFSTRQLVAVPVTTAALTRILGLPLSAIGFILFLAVVGLVYFHPEDGMGHRVGYEGFSGPHCENTIEALKDVAAKDARGDFSSRHFPFIEFDVQETKDSTLVVFHDRGLSRAFPVIGPNVEAFKVAGVDPEAAATVQELTATQLTSLHLGGREGVHVPSLKEFLE